MIDDWTLPAQGFLFSEVSNICFQSRYLKQGRLNNPYHLHERTILQDILKMILIPLLHVICTAVALASAKPEGEALSSFFRYQ